MFSSQIYCVTFVNHRCTGGFTYFALHFIHATFCIEPRIIYEQQVPEHQGTLSYKVALPLYVRGIFFSRDSRPDDYQWPNNTNRLLPWVFSRLEDLTRSDYEGIPSNALPSVSGDALLFELSDGEYLFAKAIAGDNSLSWFQVNQDGTITLYISCLLYTSPSPRD